ncbi:hypothetical protein B0T18DRAFT_410990 [Schizothecium vesticola]|uniref:RNA polymerase II transcription factor SIII subunit A n=1 Tax=Schizothecium vesticola TaxID=314040 RepID=A0AA40EV93_9PEZI|nr:hypothetical protein B0T18DRAFT_410990 [Schizothecium vesticola]
MPPRSLVDMCLTVASKNISSVTGLYGMPDPLKEVLLHAVTKANQLRAIEEDDDSYDGYAAHWQRLIAADFPVLAQKHKWAPKHSKHWSRVYDQYKKTDDDETAAATQRLAASMQGVTQAREAQKLQVKANLAKRLPPPPQPKKHWASQSAPPPPRKSALSKLRTQVKSQANRFKAAPITHYGLKLGQVERAPQTMINEARIARQPSIRGLDASKRASGNAHTSFGNGMDKAREEREQRLRQIKSQGAAPIHQNVLDFGSDDDSYSSSRPPKRSHLEDFFAERESGLTTPPGSSQQPIGANPTRRPTLLSATPGSNRPPQRSATFPNEPSTAPAVRRRTGLLSASPGANKTHGTLTRERSTRADLSPPSQAKKRTFSESADDSNSDGADAPKRPRTSASPPTQRPGSNLSAAPGANRTHGNAATTSTGRLPPSVAVKRERSPEDVKPILDKLSGPKFAAPAPLRKRPVSVLVQPKRTFRR